MAISTTRTRSAHRYHTQQIHYLHRNVTFQTPQIDTAAKVYVGVLPANSLPLMAYVRVNTGFDKDIIIGTSGSASAVASSFDVVTNTTGLFEVDRYFGTYSTVDVPLYVQTATTGASSGDVDIWVSYIPAGPST